MLIAATAVFIYYSVWTLLMVSSITILLGLHDLTTLQPFVDPDQPIQQLFPPRVWAIRIPVILILLASAVVGSFLSMVMIKSNRKKALKLKQAGLKKKA